MASADDSATPVRTSAWSEGSQEDYDEETSQTASGCRYVANCFLMPMTCGLLNGFPWSGVALYYIEQDWALWRLGLCNFAGFGIRMVVASSILRWGYWIAFPLCLAHLLLIIPAIMDQTWEVAVMIQMICILGFDTMLANDAVVFYNFRDSQAQAQQASAQKLQSLTVSFASASTFGGVIYDYLGWPGIVWYHVAMQTGQLLLYATEPAVWESYREFREKVSCPCRCRRRSEKVTDMAIPVTVVPTPDVDVDSSKKKVEEGITPPRPSLPNPPEGKGRLSASPQTSPPEAKNRISANPRMSSMSAVSFQAGQNRSSHLRPRLSGRVSQASRMSRLSPNASPRSSAASSIGDRPSYQLRPSATSQLSSSLMSQFSGSNAVETATFMARRSMLSAGVRPSVVSEAAMSAMFFDNDAEEEAQTAALPRDLYLPCALISLAAFNHNISYQTEWSLYGIFFRQKHNWTSATWGGVAQTAGDILGAIMMNIIARCGSRRTEEEGFEAGGCTWLYYSLTCKPYWYAILTILWAVCNFGMALPHVALAVASQVVMGTVFIYSNQAATDMALFFSLGDGNVFMTLQTLKQQGESIGSAVACFASLMLYESVHPNAPFYLTGGLSVAIALLYTIMFWIRDGFGRSLEEAEEARARRKGLVRAKTWVDPLPSLSECAEEEEEDAE